MTRPLSENREGLKFFGRISASVSHEIKNVFAVINESAGLIGDFTAMVERGMPLEPQRLRKVADAIQGQIRRGDNIVKNMNAFAHSTDEDVRQLDVVETLDLILALTTRLADMRQVKLSAGDRQPVSLTANPFDLMRLLHSSMVAALDRLEAGDSLILGVRPGDDGGAVFSLSSPGKDAPLTGEETFVDLAEALGASVEVDRDNGISLLHVPAG